MSLLDNIYTHLPVWGQHVAVSVYGAYWHELRFGTGYQVALQNYLLREKFSWQAWKAWEEERLLDLLQNSVRNVPYYQKCWNKSEKNAALKGRLQDLPLLDKEPIRVDPTAFLRQDILVKRPLIFYTSGSTGTPIASYWTVSELRDSLALREARSARWAGVSYKMPRATISGRLAVPDPQCKPPFYRFNLVEHQAYLSPFHIRGDSAPYYIQALRKHHIRWLTGYAVSYYLLAKLILDQGLVVPPLDAVITTSEKLTESMRKVMEAAYRCKVYEEYSTVENALFASECEKGRLHVSPDAGLVEILRPDGTPCEPDEIGEVVTTCLMRSYQPFIRYKLGDLAAWDSEPCSCGRNMPVLKEVVGRIEDVVVGPDGRLMVRFHGIFVNQPHIIEGQIIQETLNRIRVKVVTTKGFGEEDIGDIIHRVEQRLGAQVEVIVEPVVTIPRTTAGKFQSVVSQLINP